MNPDTAIASKTKRAALCVRVSTTNRSTRNQAVFEQNPEVQELPLRQMAEQRGWVVTKVYSDRMSGSKSDRPGLNALMRDARRGAFDVVVVWRFDRFARSIEQLVLALAEFPYPRNRLRIFPGSPGHVHADGQGHVHDHRRYGRTRAQCHPRAGSRRHRARSESRDQVWRCDRPTARRV